MVNAVVAAALVAICQVESGGKSAAINHNDGGSASYGACQIKFATAKSMGYKGTVSRLWLDEDTNRYWAGRYLEYQYNRYSGDIVKAISAYNCGKSCNNKLYIQKVMQAWLTNPETRYLLPKAVKNSKHAYMSGIRSGQSLKSSLTTLNLGIYPSSPVRVSNHTPSVRHRNVVGMTGRNI